MMYRQDTVEIIYNSIDSEPDFDNDMFKTNPIGKKVCKIRKEVLTTSLNTLILDVKEILDNIESSSNDAVQLSEITINAEINAQGGLQWIASGTVGQTNSISLTFKVNK